MQRIDRFSWFVLGAAAIYGGVLAWLMKGDRALRGVSYEALEDIPASTLKVSKKASNDTGAPSQSAPTKKKKQYKCTRAALASDSRLYQQAILQGDPSRFSEPVKDALDVVKYVKGQGDLPQEDVTALYLNNKNQIVGTALVSRGTGGESLVDPKDMFRAGIVSGASRVIMVHNHPSGDPTPSQMDISVTKRMDEAGKLVGLLLLDHLIIGSEGKSASMRNLGLL